MVNSEIQQLVVDFRLLVQQAKIDNQPLSIGTVLEKLEISGFSVLCIILALPFLQPIPLGPFAIFAGTTFTALGLQILRGQEVPWLPKKLQAATLSHKSWNKVVKLFALIARMSSYLARPRHKSLITGERGKKVVGTLVFISGLLMSIPMFGIPFNNTLPALVVLFVCIAELQDDGIFVYISIITLILTVIFFATIFIFLYYLGSEAFGYFGF